MSFVPNKKCCSDPRYLCPKCQTLFDRMYGRSPQARSNSVTANSGTFVINEPFRIRTRRQSQPLIPPPLFRTVDESPPAGASTLNYDPNMLLPPNTMEVIVNCHRADHAKEQQRERQSDSKPVTSRGSGPLIPPKMIW